MSTRPTGAMNESVARQIVSEHHGDAASIAVALAAEISERGGWKPNTCKPLLRAYQIAAAVPGQEGCEHAHHVTTDSGTRMGQGRLDGSGWEVCPGPGQPREDEQR